MCSVPRYMSLTYSTIFDQLCMIEKDFPYVYGSMCLGVCLVCTGAYARVYIRGYDVYDPGSDELFCVFSLDESGYWVIFD